MSNSVVSGKRKKILVFGVFDPFHKGHFDLLRQAKELGDVLTVVVARDSFIRTVKGREPVIKQEGRLKIIKEIDYVNEALLGDDWPIDNRYNLLDRLKFDVVALGYDQSPSIVEVVKELKSIGKEDVSVVRLKPFFSDRYKSSYLRQ